MRLLAEPCCATNQLTDALARIPLPDLGIQLVIAQSLCEGAGNGLFAALLDGTAEATLPAGTPLCGLAEGAFADAAGDTEMRIEMDKVRMMDKLAIEKNRFDEELDAIGAEVKRAQGFDDYANEAKNVEDVNGLQDRIAKANFASADELLSLLTTAHQPELHQAQIKALTLGHRANTPWLQGFNCIPSQSSPANPRKSRRTSHRRKNPAKIYPSPEGRWLKRSNATNPTGKWCLFPSAWHLGASSSCSTTPVICPPLS